MARHPAPLLLLLAVVGCSADAEIKARLVEAEARVAAAEAERDAAVANADAVRANAEAGEPAYTVADLDAATAEVAALRKPLEDASIAIKARESASRKLVMDPKVRADKQAYEKVIADRQPILAELEAHEAAVEKLLASPEYREAKFKVERIENALRGN